MQIERSWISLLGYCLIICSLSLLIGISSCFQDANPKAPVIGSNTSSSIATNETSLIVGGELTDALDTPLLLFDNLEGEKEEAISNRTNSGTQTNNETITRPQTTSISPVEFIPNETTTINNDSELGDENETTAKPSIESDAEMEEEVGPNEEADDTAKFEPPRNVTEYMDYIEHLFHDLRHQLSSFFEPHLPNLVRTVQMVLLSNGCSHDMLRFALALRQFEPWALKMIDASGKLPEGIFEGSFTSLGSYDECLGTQFQAPPGQPQQQPQSPPVDQTNSNPNEVEADMIPLPPTRGKYCLVNVSPYLPPKPPSDSIERIFQEEAAKRNYTGNDQMARISPMFYYMKFRIGICIPSSCTSSDMESISEALSSTLRLNITIPHCQTKQTVPYTRHQLAGGSIFGLVLALVIGTTLFDYFGPEKSSGQVDKTRQKAKQPIVVIRVSQQDAQNPTMRMDRKATPVVFTNQFVDPRKSEDMQDSIKSQPIWKSFSVINNFRSNFSQWQRIRHSCSSKEVRYNNENLISCLDGIRVISLCWVIVANSYITLDPRATKRLSRTREVPKDFLFQLVAQASLAIETFFFLSGLLMALSFYRQLHLIQRKSSGNKQKDDNPSPVHFGEWACFYLHRYIRMTPATMLVIAFTMFAFRFGDGPLWMEATQRAHMSCGENWWRHLVHLANFIDTRQMCFIHFWYIAADMQLFLFAPVLLYLIYKSKVFGYALASLIGLSSIAWIFMTTYERKLPPTLLFYNSDPESRREFGNTIMTKPLTHVLPYMVGMLLGRILATRGSNTKSTDCSKAQMKRTASNSTLKPVNERPLVFKICALLAVAVAFGEIFIPYQWNNSNLPSRLMASLYAAVFRFAWSLALAYLVLLCRHRRTRTCRANGLTNEEFLYEQSSIPASKAICKTCKLLEEANNGGGTEQHIHRDKRRQFEFGNSRELEGPINLSDATLRSARDSLHNDDCDDRVLDHERMCFCGSGGNLLNRLLSLRLFTYLSKLSFVAYLIHLPLMSVFVAQTRGLFAFSHLLVIHLALSYLLMTFILSFILVHIIEFPFVTLGRYLFDRMLPLSTRSNIPGNRNSEPPSH